MDRPTLAKAKTQHGGWERVSPYTPLALTLEFYAQGIGEQAIIDALAEAQATALEAPPATMLATCVSGRWRHEPRRYFQGENRG